MACADEHDGLMTNGKSITAREVELALRTLHDSVREAARASHDVEDARSTTAADVMDALGNEITYLREDDPDRLECIHFEWEGGSPHFERLLVEDTEQVRACVSDYLAGGGPETFFPTTVRRMDASTGTIHEWQPAQRMAAARDAFQAAVQSARLDELRQQVECTWESAATLLRSWVRQDTPSLPEWGRIQRAWREALGLPGNQAAAILGVSAPTVTRYEKGERIPSRAYVESMVKRVLDAGTSPAAATTNLLASLDVLGIKLSDIIEPFAADEAAVRDELQLLSERLAIEDVQLLVGLARHPESLNALRSVPATDPLGPLRAALNDLAVQP